MAAPTPPRETTPGAPYLIINPTKLGNADALTRLTRLHARRLGLPDPVVLTTTPDDPGTGQATRAVAEGAGVVVAVGGDGTARAVAQALAHTGVPMGIVPLGTGNLFARNLHLPIADRGAALRIALAGRTRPYDVGWLTTHHALDTKRAPASTSATDPDDPAEDPDVVSAARNAAGPDEGLIEELFLVIGGIGFDADMVAGAHGEMKRRVGWLAYFWAALPKLFQRRMEAMVTVDGQQRSRTFRARTVMVANCGKLPGGLVLAPSARPDDGVLDAVALDTRGGILGWAALGVRVVMQSAGLAYDANVASTISSKRGREFRVHVSRPQPVEVDGEVLGSATEVTVRVDPGALLVRVA